MLQLKIRQMKIVMNKKLGDAENERKKLTQELMSARRFTLRDGSNSEDSVRGPPSNPGARSTEKAQNGGSRHSNSFEWEHIRLKEY